LRDPDQLEALGTFFAGNLSVAYLAFFLVFAGIEAGFGKGGEPAAAMPGRMIVNFSLPIMAAFLALVVPFGVTTAAIVAGRSQWGLFNWIVAPPLVILAAAMLSRTGFGYLVHRLSHRVPLLWRLHKVHHADPHVDISLALRHHPLEPLPGLAGYAVGTLLLGLPVWAVALVEATLIAASYSDHLDLLLPPRAARLLQLLLVTPDVHRLHHSADRAQTDSNYGSLLILWDRLFGSYRAPEEESIRRYGLDEVGEGEANSLAVQLALPFLPAAGRRTSGEPVQQSGDILAQRIDGIAALHDD
jgi:sterol desaturase/sphingolipid hydroxylase (fatty acid hydroxylase superfamily)